MSPPQVLHLALSSFPKINRAVATLFAFSIATFACFGVSGCSRERRDLGGGGGGHLGLLLARVLSFS